MDGKSEQDQLKPGTGSKEILSFYAGSPVGLDSGKKRVLQLFSGMDRIE